MAKGQRRVALAVRSDLSIEDQVTAHGAKCAGEPDRGLVAEDGERGRHGADVQRAAGSKEIARAARFGSTNPCAARPFSMGVADEAGAAGGGVPVDWRIGPRYEGRPHRDLDFLAGGPGGGFERRTLEHDQPKALRDVLAGRDRRAFHEQAQQGSVDPARRPRSRGKRRSHRERLTLS